MVDGRWKTQKLGAATCRIIRGKEMIKSLVFRKELQSFYTLYSNFVGTFIYFYKSDTTPTLDIIVVCFDKRILTRFSFM